MTLGHFKIANSTGTFKIELHIHRKTPEIHPLVL